MEDNERRLTATEVINKIKEYKDDDFVLSMDRDKNAETINEYNLTSSDIIDFIKCLTIKNMPHCVNNHDNRNKTKHLYEFQKNLLVNLVDFDGNDKVVSMYFKGGFHKNKHIIYGVSFHEDDMIR